MRRIIRSCATIAFIGGLDDLTVASALSVRGVNSTGETDRLIHVLTHGRKLDMAIDANRELRSRGVDAFDLTAVEAPLQNQAAAT